MAAKSAYRPAFAAALTFLALSALVVIGSAVADMTGRAASTEAAARAYFAALEMGDADAALAQLEPSVRSRWVDFVENGLNNEYRVVGLATRYASILERLGGASADPLDVTVFLDITQAVDGVRWEATPRVEVRQDGGRWFLLNPPLAPI